MSQAAHPDSLWFEPQEWTSEQRLYHGIRTRDPERSIRIVSPTKREPVSMPRLVQRDMDDWFSNAFGIRFRESALFATGDLTYASQHTGFHGEVRFLRPATRFTYCWSPLVKDLFLHWRNHPLLPIGQLLDECRYQMTDLDAAALSGNEIMLLGTFEAFQLDPTQ